PNGKLLFHCDSTTCAVWVHEVRSDRTLSERRVFARLPEGMPDGMTVDLEGGIWVAVVGGPGEVVRFKNDGTLERRIKVPAKTVTTVTLTGADMRDLLIATTNNDRGGLKGTLLRARSDIPGIQVPRARF
ncbi:MAG: SMP-30/gluconolactonase/LRE family protein, partial [Candidatus Binataceae bacterium]